MITFSNDIPPPKAKRPGRPPVYPWATLKVNGSFHLPGRFISEISPLASNRSRTHPGEQYRCRSVDGGVRVWRVA